jgi:hypothetical protein
MSRLRNIQGVTRVSLSKSEKADAAAAGAGQTVGPCGKGSPPSFDLVVFFEKATVGAALADATKTVSTAAAAEPAATPDPKTGKTPEATPTPGATP